MSVEVRAVWETLVNGGSLRTILDLVANDQPKFVNAFSALIMVYEPVRNRITFTGEGDPDIEWFLKEASQSAMCIAANQHLADGDMQWLKVCAEAMCIALEALRDNGLRWTLPPPAAALTPEPMAVRVTAMPDRVTDTAVTYDNQGNIKASRQVEKDAA